MNTTIIKSLALLLVGLIFWSCAGDDLPDNYKGYTKLEEGVFYKFFKKNSPEILPIIGDVVAFNTSILQDEKILVSTFEDETNYDERLITENPITPTEKLLAKMSIGDSLSMLILVDSLEQLPMGFEGGDYMEVILKAFKKTSKDDREKDNKTALIGLKKHPNGRFYWKKHISKTGVFPRPNDQVELYFQLRKGNDIFYQTASNKPDIITLPVEGTDVSPLHQVLQQMVVGDSVTAAFEIASMSKDIQASMIQSGFFAGDIMTIDVSLLTLKDSLTLAKEQAEIKKQQEAELAATKSFGKRLEQLIPQKIQDYKDGKLQTIRTPSGLKYVIHEKGKGPILENHQTAFVHYIGFLTNQKTKFDSSFDRGKSFNFEVGGKEVINGWEEAIRLLPVGTKATLFVPYHLGYGETGSKVIPPYANLTFYIEVVGGR
ncbi:MAG: FKBP-type peptidyl-prolyl cis-trans isomerase [Saprospiraceae bacterium]